VFCRIQDSFSTRPTANHFRHAPIPCRACLFFRVALVSLLYYIYKIDCRVSQLRNFLLTGILPFTGFTFDLPEHQSYIYIFYYTVPVTALQIRRSYFSRPRATTLKQPFLNKIAFSISYIYVLLHIYKLIIAPPCPTRTLRHYFITALFKIAVHFRHAPIPCRVCILSFLYSTSATARVITLF
jgi:hypothetical protein